MKKYFFVVTTLLLNVFGFLALASCDNDDNQSVSKPVAALAEVGEENNKTAMVGKDLHLEGNLEADGLIARIDLQIATADGKTIVLTKTWTDEKYIGKRNTLFHEHVDIPATVSEGDYKLAFTVTDKLGQAATFTSDLRIEAPAEGAPTISLTEVGEDNGKTAVVGGEMHLEAGITAPKKIDNIKVELHNTSADYEKVFTFKEKYLGQTTAKFHEHLQIPADAPVGEYHLHFTVTDAEGNTTTEEAEGVQITKKQK